MAAAQEDKPHRLAHRLKRVVKWASFIGAVAGLTCHFLPHEYQALCHAVVNICT